MPIISGLILPKKNPTSHIGDIILLWPVVMAIDLQEDSQTENDNTKDAEEPEEILHIVSEVGSIVFLVPLPYLFVFINTPQIFTCKSNNNPSE